MGEFIPTDEQQAIAQAVRGSKRVAVNAGAGTGKTSTTKWLIRHGHLSGHIVYLAFNAPTAKEFKATTTGAEAKTFNGLGYAAMCRHYNTDHEGFKISAQKYGDVVWDWVALNLQHLNADEAQEARDMLRGVIEKFMVNTTFEHSGSRELKLYMGTDENEQPIYQPLDPADLSALYHLCLRYSLNNMEKIEDTMRALEGIEQILEVGKMMMDYADQNETIKFLEREQYMSSAKALRDAPNKRLITFTEQVYRTITENWMPTMLPDWIAVDEAQDISPFERALIDLHLKPDAGLMIIGDPQQAIYAFKGADTRGFVNSMTFWDIPTAYPLSLSRRCPKRIAAMASTWKPDFRALSSAPEGEISFILDMDLLDHIKAGDAVICRVRAPMVELWKKLLRAGKPAVIIGGDVSGRVIEILQTVQRRKGYSFSKLTDCIVEYKEKRLERMRKLGKDPAEMEDFIDAIDTVFAMIDGIKAYDMGGLIEQIKQLFSRQSSEAIKIMTGHGSKGLEFPRVFNYTPDKFPWLRSDNPKVQEQEYNLRYVMWTRVERDYFEVWEKEEDRARNEKAWAATYQPVSVTVEPAETPALGPGQLSLPLPASVDEGEAMLDSAIDAQYEKDMERLTTRIADAERRRSANHQKALVLIDALNNIHMNDMDDDERAEFLRACRDLLDRIRAIDSLRKEEQQ